MCGCEMLSKNKIDQNPHSIYSSPWQINIHSILYTHPVYMISEPFLSNDLFIHYADIVLIEPHISLYDSLTNFRHKSSILIFLQTELLEHYLSPLINLQTPFVLLTTCNDDYCIPYYYFPPKNSDIQQRHNTLLTHPFLLRWFTKNPSIVHPKLHPLPLGPKWQYHSHRFFGEDKAPLLTILHKYCMTPSIDPPKLHLLYFHFSQTTSDPFFTPHKNMRQDVVDLLQSRFPHLYPPISKII